MNKIKNILAYLGMAGDVAKFTVKSNSTVSAFLTVIKGLQALNEAIIKCREKKLVEKNKLEMELDALNEQAVKNERAMSNINNMFE